MLNLNQLRIFHSVASLSSFTRAADAMHLTQPGISKHVKQLEDYYGIRLFERRGKRIALTEAGQILFETTHEVISSVERADRRIKELDDVAPKLRLAATFTAGLYVVPGLLATFRKHHPAIEPTLEVLLASVIEAKLMDYTFDIGLVGHEITNKKLSAKQFFTDELVAIVPVRHKWASLKRKIRPDEFLSEPFITTAVGSGTRCVIEDRLQQNGVKLTKVLDFGNMEAVKKAVEAGLGVSILSKIVIQREVSTGLLRMLPVAGTNMKRRFLFLHRKDKLLSVAANAFLKHLSRI
jgi:DNA-binding transcriptional LysR family regulator